MIWQLIILSVALLAVVNGLPKMGGKDKGHPPPPSMGHRGGGRLPYPAPGPPPEYLQEVSENAREEHFQLMMENEEMPKGQLKEELAKWAEKSGAKVKMKGKANWKNIIKGGI